MKLVYYQVFPTMQWVLTSIDKSSSNGIDNKLWAIFESKESLVYFLNKTNLSAVEKDSYKMSEKDYFRLNP